MTKCEESYTAQLGDGAALTVACGELVSGHGTRHAASVVGIGGTRITVSWPRELRPEDYMRAREVAERGPLRSSPLPVGLHPDSLLAQEHTRPAPPPPGEWRPFGRAPSWRVVASVLVGSGAVVAVGSWLALALS